MCAIAGLIHSQQLENHLSSPHEISLEYKSKRTDLINESMTKALHLMSSRGPDATRIHYLSTGVFGHNRLAIIDLSSSAEQPMQSSDLSLTIVFNGEIYNYADLRRELAESGLGFRTESDTEVILVGFQFWGIGLLLKKLRGMFSFCIWDEKTKAATFARDHLGVKPFYYSFQNGTFGFASRPTAVRELMQLPVTIDHQALRYYYEFGFIPAPQSAWNEIKKLPPGHFGTVQNGKFEIQSYWTDAKIRLDEKLSEAPVEKLLKELEERVLESVRLRLVSDVPVGVFLSGGIDSSIVAAAMKRLSPEQKIKSFNIGFSDPQFDESDDAKKIAAVLGTEHFSKTLSADDVLTYLPYFIKNFDEPFYDYSALPVMAVAELAKPHVKVVLSGDGGDEAFGGYHYYEIINRIEFLYRWPSVVRKIAGFFLRVLPQKKFKILGHVLAQETLEAGFAFMRSPFKLHHHLLSESFFENTRGALTLVNQKSKTFPSGLSGAERAMRLDSQLTLVDDYLQKVDVGTMAFSIEARDPLLDYQLIEFSRKLSLKWKLNGHGKTANKFLLRELAYKWVGKEILDRPKKGFGLPMADWLREIGRAHV